MAGGLLGLAQRLSAGKLGQRHCLGAARRRRGGVLLVLGVLEIARRAAAGGITAAAHRKAVRGRYRDQVKRSPATMPLRSGSTGSLTGGPKS